MATNSLGSLKQYLLVLGVDSELPLFPGANILINPIDIFRSYVAESISRLIAVDRILIYSALQWANTLETGDLLLVVPRLRLKGVNPNDVAEDLVSKFPATNIVLPPTAKQSYVQFRFNPRFLSRLLIPYIFDRESLYGRDTNNGLLHPPNPESGRKKMIVEYSSPNIAKEFHAGHLRSTIIGSFLAKLYESSNWDVTTMNYLGDWGKQFGLLAVGWERFGSEEKFKANPLGHLFEIYIKISSLFKVEEHARDAAKERKEDTAIIESQGLFAERNSYFSRMEAGDQEVLGLWKRFREVSIERYIATYARLNIKFDVYSGESQVQPKTMEFVEKLLADRKISEQNDGALIIDFKKHDAKKLDIAIVRNRTGTTTYLLRDLAACIERYDEYSFDKMIYVVSSEQDIYFRRLFKTIELLGYKDLAQKVQHINFGKVEGMSTRKGNVVFLNDILDDCGAAMHDVMRRNEAKYTQIKSPDAVADTLGITAVMVQDMSGKRINNYPFDMNRMTSFEGDTGPFLQYTHARLASIMRKGDLNMEDLRNAEFTLLSESHAVDLLRLLAQYPDVISNTLKTQEPTTILTYLFRLARQLSSSYDVLRVVNPSEGPKTASARAALFECARQVLSNGMRLLGYSPVDRM